MTPLPASFLIAALLLPPLPAAAADDTGPGEEAAMLERVESYYNSIRSLRARFTQNSPQGVVQGTVYLRKPGNMRVEYDPPSQILLVANGNQLVYYDGEVDQVSYVSPEETPLWLLLRNEVSFAADSIDVLDVHRTRGVIEITVARADDPGAGQLTLVFDADPLLFRQWRGVDPQGTETAVTLHSLQTGVSLSDALFRFQRPGNGGTRN